MFDTASGVLLRQWEAPELPIAVGKRRSQEAKSANSEEQDSNNCTKTLEGTAAVGVEDVEGGALKKRKVEDISSSPRAPLLVENVNAPSDSEPTQKRKRFSFREQAGMGGWSPNKGCNLITSMVGTSTGRHLVVATNEDKTVRVFDASKLRDSGENEGELQLLSEWYVRKVSSAPGGVVLREVVVLIMVS